jgi:hypothetical protein
MTPILVGILILLAIAVFFDIYGKINYFTEHPRDDITPIRDSISSLNDTKANRDGVVYALGQLSENISSITSKVSLLERNLSATKPPEQKDYSAELKGLENRIDGLMNEVNKLKLEVSRLNQTPAPAVPPTQSCRQALITKHQLGSLFDVVYCCESRAYGFADECCACYK